MTGTRGLLAVALGCGVLACSSMQTRLGDHLPKKRFIDSVAAAAWHAGPMSVGRERDLNLQRSNGLGLVHAPELQAYLKGVLDRLVAVSPVAGVPAHVGIRASEDFGATSTADANVFVNLGLIRKMESEDELAFVLGHELSHVILGHTSSEIVQKTQRQLAVLTEIGGAVENRIRAAQGEHGTGTMAKESRIKDQNRLILLNTLVLNPAWTRGQEREADLLGTDLLAKAGYDPKAVDEVMGKLIQAERDTSRPTVDTVVEDIKRIEDVAPREATSGARAAAQAADASSSYGLGLVKTLGGEALTYVGTKAQELKSDHPKAEERQADLRRYVEREYAGASAAVARQQPLRQALGEPRTKEILAHYEQAYEAWDFLQQGNDKVAEKLARSSLSGSTSDHASPRYYVSLMREKQGDLRKALEILEVAYDAPEPSLRVYQRSSELRDRLGDNRGAIELLERANRKFGEPPTLMPDLIQAYRRAGRKADADRLALECATKYPEIKSACVGGKPEAAR